MIGVKIAKNVVVVDSRVLLHTGGWVVDALCAVKDEMNSMTGLSIVKNVLDAVKHV